MQRPMIPMIFAAILATGAFGLAMVHGQRAASLNGPADGSRMLAQVAGMVGVAAGVESNPFNTLMQQLKDKERRLLEREQSLAQKENATGGVGVGGTPPLVWGMGGVLFVLIVTNYVLDYRRRRKEGAQVKP